ncbi:hypothetical protein KDM89_20035, partial [Undibacterium sp. LFS511W]|nr:hypothetical protein [Undibacterium luofuense]
MSELSTIAEAYVRLVLAVGLHDPGYVDAYIGPQAWRDEAQHLPLAQLQQQAADLLGRIAALSDSDVEQKARQAFLRLQIASVKTYIEQLMGQLLPFDQESLALYDAVSP